MNTGAVKCWGANSSGQLGDGTTTDRVAPTPVSGLSSNVAAVSGGISHTCAVTTAGGATCWGANYYGQLGDATTADRLTQTPVSGLSSGIAAMTGGRWHTCAVTTGGGALCWGDNSRGALGTGARVVGLTPLPAYGLGGAIAAGAATPNHGDEAGGTVVTLTGAYFLQGATVTIGGAAATVVSVVNTTEILAVTGPHASGTVDIVITNPDATQATLTGGFTYGEAATPPRVGDFTGDLKSGHPVAARHGRGRVAVADGRGGEGVGDLRAHGGGRELGDPRPGRPERGREGGPAVAAHESRGCSTTGRWTGRRRLAETYVGTVDPAYDIVGTGDFNGDGKSDILWRHTAQGDVWVWLMNGATPLSEVYVDTVDPGYVVKGVGDVDGDLKADLVWHGAAGDVWVWLMNGPARLSQTYVGTVADTHYQIQQVADFDGNGKADLLWWNAVQGDVWIWPMDGTTVLAETYVGAVPDTNYRIVGSGGLQRGRERRHPVAECGAGRRVGVADERRGETE